MNTDEMRKGTDDRPARNRVRGPATITVDPEAPDPRALQRAADIIRQGGLVAYPTETVYGLAADPFSHEAVTRLSEAKGRISPRAMILLIPRADAAFDLVEAPGPARDWYRRLATAFWPGPLTIVLPARRRLECAAIAGGESVGLRVTPHPVARLLVQMVGGPITSTSANPSGAGPASAPADLDPGLAARLDLVLDGGASPGGRPSTIIDLTGTWPAVTREGAVGIDRVAGVLGRRPRRGTSA